MVITSTIGMVFAVDTAKLESMDADKSIGYQGVMNATMKPANTELKALCTDKGQYITFGTTVPVSDSTTKIPNSNSVKQLIVDNYREDMTKQEGYDLQQAIWYFTDGIIPTTPGSQSMVEKVINNPRTVPDKDVQVLLFETKKLIDTKTSIETILIATTSTSKDKITLEDKKTFTETIEKENCITTITTIIEYFNKETITNIINTYQKTTKITETYQIIKEYLTFNFYSYTDECKQDLIFFQVTPTTTEDTIQEENTKTETFTETETETTNTPYTNTQKNIETTCKPKPTPEPTPTPTNQTKNTQNTIPMQKTGIPINYLIIGIIATLIGVGLRR